MNRLTTVELLASWLIGAGILFLLMGWKAYRFIPMSKEEAIQEEKLQAIIRLTRQAWREVPAEQRSDFKKMIDRLEQMSIRFQRRPPDRDLGTVAMLLGGFGAVFGAIVWFRGRPKGQRWIPWNEDA
jgi:hypothetical protein